jgi:hypothetical protein
MSINKINIKSFVLKSEFKLKITENITNLESNAKSNETKSDLLEEYKLKSKGRGFQEEKSIKSKANLQSDIKQIVDKLAKLRMKIKIIDNLSNSYVKKVSEEKNYITLMLTVTFGKTSNASISENIKCNYPNKYLELLKKQHKSLMHFIKKLRKTKLIKHKKHYFCVFELQDNGNLHFHMHLMIHENDLEGFINFVYWYKKKEFKGYYNIGRTYIELSSIYKKIFEKKFTLIKTKDKPYPGKPYNDKKISYVIKELDNRDFNKGESTFWEFLSVKDIRDRYDDNIVKYLKKTLVAKFTSKQIDNILNFDKNKVKIHQRILIEGWIKYSLKSILNSIDYPQDKNESEKFRNNVNTIRKVGQVYTFSNSTFTLKFKLYQQYYTRLKNLHKKYGFYYNADKDFEFGILILVEGEFQYKP